MTAQELLIPRYRLIAAYPFNAHFVKNEVITLDSIDNDTKERFVRKTYLPSHDKIVQNTTNFNESTFKKYPHIFKKLEWWEDRTVDQMPEHIKTNVESPIVFKVKEWFQGDAGCYFMEAKSGKGNIVLTPYLTVPATEEEYLNYQSQ